MKSPPPQTKLSMMRIGKKQREEGEGGHDDELKFGGGDTCMHALQRLICKKGGGI